MARIAYVTADVDFLDPDPDWDLPDTVAALRAAGLEVDAPKWDDAAVDWASYDLALIRSTWNYAKKREQFIAWADHVDTVSRLLNPADVVRDNTDKAYLARFIAAGLPVVPTQVVAPGGVVEWNDPALAGATKVVVKPTVGAGAIGASVHTERANVESAVNELHSAGRTALVQPYLDKVDAEGEVAIVVIDGVISHGVTKVPALSVGGHGDAQGDAPITDSMRAYVERVAELVPQWSDLLYARVDVVPDGAGSWVLMELELTEPTLFLTQHAPATDLLVQGVLRRLN